MNKKFRTIINILILILIVILVYVMMNYYASGSSFVPAQSDVTSQVPEVTNKPQITPVIVIEKSGEELAPTKDDETPSDGLSSGEPNEPFSEVIITPSKTPSVTQEREPMTSSPVIMTSENEISSKEKREILNELDQTLMELLEVVDKVQTVDESRLPTDSEVQEP